MNGRVSIQTRSESVQNAKVPISIDLKKCGCCKKIKSVEEFSKRGKNKRQSNCKLCKSIYAKKYYYDNYNYSINRVKKYYEENKEARKQYSKNYRRENPEAVKIRAKKWLKENPDYYKQHYQVPAVKKNKSEYFKKYCKENPEKRKECVKRRRKRRQKTQ